MVLLLVMAGATHAADLPSDRPNVTFDAAKQDAMTPDMAIEKLKVVSAIRKLSTGEVEFL